MIIKCLSLVILIGALFAETAGAQAGSSAQGGVSHGVSRQYEQQDSFPIYNTHTVQVGNSTPYYDPPEITVAAGDLVNWVNKRLSDTHTIINGNGQFESSPVPAEKNWCYHFVQEGDYEYSCRFHPWMKGVVHVRRRELPLEPVQSSSVQDLNILRRAHFLAANSTAVEASSGGYWVRSMRSGILEYHDPVQGKSESTPLPGITQPITPLAMAGNRLVVGVPGVLLSVDPISKRILHKLVLPKTVFVVRAAAISDHELWASDAQGTALLFIDLERNTIRSRPLAAGSRIAAIRQQGATVWALDTGRNFLLKLGMEWINEVPLPQEIGHPNSLAADAEGKAWFIDSRAGIAAVVLPNSTVQKFTIPQAAGAQLLQLAESSSPLLADFRGGHFFRVNLPEISAGSGHESTECLGAVAAEGAQHSVSVEARKNQ